MAFFRAVSSNETVPGITGAGVTLRAPHSGDFAEWAALRETSRRFLVPWEPTGRPMISRAALFAGGSSDMRKTNAAIWPMRF